jgi:2,4-dienoyl-CoA reductase-like NADH-dependent reductase (Old Yellow Enzyme family)
MLFVEATAVEAIGRITPGCLGLYSDENEHALGRVVAAIRKYSPIALGIQLAHAGRKGSSEVPWRGGQLIPADRGGWRPVGPSALPQLPQEEPPVALDRAGLRRIRERFVAAAHRALRLGFDAIELHSAHGYLLHEFLSPLSNQRDDEYGGSLENRMRFPLEVFDAVREAFPADRPVTMRVSGTDWAPGGWDIEQTIAFATALEARGCGGIHVSSGGLTPAQKIPLGPSYQVPLARAVKQATTMPVVAVGLITEFEQAEAIVSTGDADLVALARVLLYNPRWPWHAAAHFGASVVAPNQYLRSQPSRYRDLFAVRGRP